MKAPQFYITTGLSALCLVLSVAVIYFGQANQSLQAKLQGQQDEINRGSQSLQIGKNLLNDMAQISLKNDKIKQVLARNGYTVNVNPASSASPSPAQ